MSIRLVWDKSACTAQIGHVALFVAAREHPPFPCQALVVEQDTHLLLDEPTILVEPEQPAWYLASTLERDQPEHRPGEVIVRRGQPLRLWAVVHDIEKRPTCDHDDILHAWQNILRITAQQNINTLAAPALGSEHGKVTVEEALQLLNQSIHEYAPACLEKIWLILPDNKQVELASAMPLRL